MNLFNFGGIIGDAIADMWMSIWLSLNDLVYNIIEVLYRVFEAVAKINLFSDKDYELLTGRVYVIMGVAMLFILAYNLLLMIINPEDKKGTGQMAKMVKEIIISLVLIVLLPMIFNWMAIFQRHILDSNILGQIIIGDTGGTIDKCEYDQYDFLGNGTNIQNSSSNSPDVALNNDCDRFTDDSITPPGVRGAYSIAPTLFSAFYHPTNYGFTQCKEYYDKCKNEGDDCATDVIAESNDKEMCKYYFHDVKKAVFTGSLKPFNEDSFFYSKVKKNEETFEFNYLLAFIAGCFAVYMFVCYTIAIGVRVAKLGFFQIVSPIAVMMRIIPKQKEAIFDKWLKNLKDAYLDVFIRLAIIYFSLFAISLVPGVIDNMGVDADGSFTVWLLAKVVLILGILKFAQDAPGLLKEFFGNAGTFALKSPKKQLGENKLAMAGMGLAAGGIGAASRNMFKGIRDGKNFGDVLKTTAGGLIGGARRGAKAGYKSDMDSLSRNTNRAIDETTDKRRERASYKALHGGTWGAIKGHIGDHIDSRIDWYGARGDRDILNSIKYEDDIIKHYDDYESLFKSGGYQAKDARLKEMKAAEAAGGSYDGMKGANLTEAIKRLEASMQEDRVNAIKKNSQNAAYVAYEFAKSMNSDPEQLKRIKEKLGKKFTLSDDDIEELKGLSIKSMKDESGATISVVVDKNGNKVDADLATRLLEGAGIDGGLYGLQGKIKGQASADKQSVSYKHQTKLEQERKDKESKK